MDLERISALVGFQEHGNISKAAASLGVSKKTLRSRLAALERVIGAPLLRRSGRSLVLTPAGVELAQGGRGLLREAEAALEWVANQGEELAGSFRVAIPLGLPPALLVMVLGHGHARFPKLRSKIYPVARPLALLPDEADIALTFEPRPEEGPWLSARLAEGVEGLFASKDYLAREGIPERVEDLHDHRLFSWMPPGRTPEVWPLRDGGSFIASLSHCSPDMGLIRHCVLAGLGIGRFPTGEIPNPELPPGALVPVLPELVRQRVEIRAVLPDTPRMRRPFLTFFGNLREGVKALPNG